MPSTFPSGRDPDDEDELENDWSDDNDDDREDDFHDPAFVADDDDDSEETVPCPACGRPVYEGADYCPDCGAAIVPDGPGPSRKAWMVAAALIVTLLAGVLYWL